MSLSNKKNKVDDNEILETFFRGFFTDTKVLEEIGNAENKIVFTYSDLFFFFSNALVVTLNILSLNTHNTI